MQLVAAGDPRARNMVAMRLCDRVRRIERALLTGRADADDATQDALVAILRSAANYRGESSRERWADRIAARTGLRFRARERSRSTESETDVPTSDAHELHERLPRPLAAYLREAIDSVLAQTVEDFELLIMDDGSTDDTPAILAHYAGCDRRIRVFQRQHQGQTACRNKLLQLATTDIVACADADDICLPDRLERQLAAMTKDADLWILGTAAVSIDQAGRRRRSWRVPTARPKVARSPDSRAALLAARTVMA